MEDQIFDLGPRSKEILSWMVLSELLKVVSDDVFVGVLHPGDGQYDCLSLLTANQGTPIMLNREGSSAIVNGQVVGNIWPRAAVDPNQSCMFIVSKADIGLESDGISSNRQVVVDTCIRIASFLNEGYNSNLKAVWGWSDSTYGSGPSSLLSNFDIAEEWKVIAGPSDSISWQGWLFCITQDDKPVILVNMKTGESIDYQGKNWNGWPQDFKNSFGKNAAPLGFKFEIQWPTGSKMTLDCVHPSMKRKTNTIYTLEEGCTVKVTPVFRIKDKQEAEAMWGMVDNSEKHKKQLKDLLG